MSEDLNNTGVLEVDYLSAENSRFATGPNGFLELEHNGKSYPRVILTRSLPLTEPDEFICVTDVEKNEIGIIKSVSDFDGEQRTAIKNELELRYFCPIVTSIVSVKEKMGHFYFDVMIGDRKKSFTVKDLTKSVRYHGKGFDLIDVDGNRYRIEDYDKISSKSKRKIDAYLY